MPYAREIINSFNSGEWSPLLEGRTDLAKYKSAVRQLINLIPQKFGGATRRPGLRFVDEVKDSSKKTRIIKFQFSAAQSYIIELGNLYMRFYKNSGRIENPPGTPVEIVTTYLEADLFNIQFAQSADVLYMACQGYPPRKLTRTSDILWAIVDVPFTAMPAIWGSGYPGCVTLYEQRAWYANTVNGPDTLWGSQTGNYENFTVGTGLDHESVELTLSSRTLNAISSLAAQAALVALTSGQEHFITGAGGADDPITPSSFNSKSKTKYGSSTQASIEAGNAILFLQRSGRKLREITVDPTSASYVGPFPDLTLLAEHITAGGIKQMDYQQELDSLVWCVRADGALLSLTYEKPQDVVAWARHFTGTAQNASDGKFESVAVIPHPDGDQDQTWVVVNRTIGGATKRYIEYFDTKGGYYGNLNVDCGLVYSGAATGTLGGLTHLIGQTVDILGNGAVYPQQVVNGSGQVTGLMPQVTSAEVGLHFDSTLETMRPELPASSGTIQGAPKKISQITVRLYKSMGGRVAGDQLIYRKSSDHMGAAVPLFSGDKKTSTSGWGTDGTILIQQKQPLPLTVLCVVAVMDTSE